MIHLRSLRLTNRGQMPRGYPFDLPLVGNLHGLAFDAPVTFFVGENGTGKSTVLSAIAAAAGAITVGGEDIRVDPTMAPARGLAAHLSLSWQQKTHRGFFMRAEDFFNFGRSMAKRVRELDEEATAFARDMSGYGLQLAQGAVRGQCAALVRAYGEDLNARSHGEGFLQLFQARFVPGGLYLLDEPDTALSPQRQLALMAMLKEMVAQDGQFVIATHSPMLLAFPGASILAFDGQTIVPVAYDAVESVTLMRAFLANPSAFTRRL